MSIIKFLKIALPVTTVTSSTIATTLLVSSFNKKDELTKKEDLDNSLNDLKLPDEKYEDSKKFYAKNGTGDGQKPLDEEVRKRIADLLDKAGDLSDGLDIDKKIKNLEKALHEIVSSPEGTTKANSQIQSEETINETLNIEQDAEEQKGNSSSGGKESAENEKALKNQREAIVIEEEPSLAPDNKSQGENQESLTSFKSENTDLSEQPQETNLNNHSLGSHSENTEREESVSGEVASTGEAEPSKSELNKGHSVGSGIEREEDESVSVQESNDIKEEEHITSESKEKLNEVDIKQLQDWENKLSFAQQRLSQLITI